MREKDGLPKDGLYQDGGVTREIGVRTVVWSVPHIQ